MTDKRHVYVTRHGYHDMCGAHVTYTCRVNTSVTNM
jgi:hypothetical protein